MIDFFKCVLDRIWSQSWAGVGKHNVIVMAGSVRRKERRIPERSDEARLWRVTDLGGLELLRASYVRFVFTPHAHEEFLITLTEEGIGNPVFRRESHSVGPGDIFILNPEESHAGGPSNDAHWGYRAIYPSRDLLERFASEFSGWSQSLPEFNKSVVQDREVAARLRQFHVLCERQDASQLQRESCLTAALVALVTRHSSRPRKPRQPGTERRAIRVAREYLDWHAAENVSLIELASVVGLSPFHLCRVFKQVVGLAPHAYQSQIRVRRAKQLMAQGIPIAQAAVEAGFYDQAHLTRHFKRVVGLTPGRYAAGRGSDAAKAG
jgi:AraC-like DNA-binding protein